jgi:cutinase
MHRRLRAPAVALALVATAAFAVACTRPPVKPDGDPSLTIACSGVEVLVVRGSGEPGDGGSHVGGIARKVADAIDGSTYYDVPYPASFNFADSTPRGVSAVLNHLLAQAAKCPDQRYVLMGHSQGTMVLHDAYGGIPDDVFDRIPAVVLFGAPHHKWDSPANAGTATKADSTGISLPGRIPPKVEAKALDFCNKGDAVCGAGLSVQAHYTYDNPDEVGQAIAFVLDKLQ